MTLVWDGRAVEAVGVAEQDQLLEDVTCAQLERQQRPRNSPSQQFLRISHSVASAELLAEEGLLADGGEMTR